MKACGCRPGLSRSSRTAVGGYLFTLYRVCSAIVCSLFPVDTFRIQLWLKPLARMVWVGQPETRVQELHFTSKGAKVSSAIREVLSLEAMDARIKKK